MTDVSWSSATVLGVVPLFHLDPTFGGPPLVTPDGHWRWDGERWCVRHEPEGPEWPEGREAPEGPEGLPAA